MGAQQWAQSDLLNNSNLSIVPASYVSLTSAYDVGMNFLLQPEIKSAGCDVSFTAAEAMTMFAQDLTADTDNKSFLNPTNYFLFQELYETNAFTTILGNYALS